MATATLPPKTNNGVLNSEFNSSDFAVSANDTRYLKLTGGTISGALAVNSSTTTNGLTSLAGTNRFNSNINLPTTYTASPNTAFPTSTQLGGVLTAVETNGQVASPGVIKTIISTILTPGVWIISWRGVISPTAAGTGTYANVRFQFSELETMAVSEIQRVQIWSSQSATQGAANGFEVALMGSTILQVGVTKTYFLCGCSSYTSTQPSKWTGHIHAVRIG